MEARYATSYGEPKPSTAGFRRACRVDSVEALKDPFRVFWRYANAVVFNRYGKTARRARNQDGDIGRTRMAYRVRDEIANSFAD